MSSFFLIGLLNGRIYESANFGYRNQIRMIGPLMLSTVARIAIFNWLNLENIVDRQLIAPFDFVKPWW